MKIVLMKNVVHNYESLVEVLENDDLSYWLNGDYAQISEIIEVDFPSLDTKTVINNQVAVIDKQITKVMADSQASITVLNGRKQELLAIGHDNESI
jgi:hypothetical protein